MKNKYIKYKTKYLRLREQLQYGGMSCETFDVDIYVCALYPQLIQNGFSNDMSTTLYDVNKDYQSIKSTLLTGNNFRLMGLFPIRDPSTREIIKIPFYKSSGMNSGNPNLWFPFIGISYSFGGVIKPLSLPSQFYSDNDAKMEKQRKSLNRNAESLEGRFSYSTLLMRMSSTIEDNLDITYKQDYNITKFDNICYKLNYRGLVLPSIINNLIMTQVPDGIRSPFILRHVTDENRHMMNHAYYEVISNIEYKLKETLGEGDNLLLGKNAMKYDMIIAYHAYIKKIHDLADFYNYTNEKIAELIEEHRIATEQAMKFIDSL